MPEKNTDTLEIHGQQIFHWHLELSSKCALKCPRCPRTERPGQYKVTEMNLDFVKKILPAKRLSLVQKILLSGGQGDAIYCNDFLKIIKYFKETNPNLQLCITTNGSYKKQEWWKEAAKILQRNDIVIFSVDGWDQQSNEQYRVGSHFPSIMEGLKTLREFNQQVYIVWSTIIFKFNQNRLNDIQNLAESMGADAFNLVQSRLFGSTNSDYIDPKLGYDPLEPDKNRIETSNTNRGCYIDFTKRSSSHNIKPTIAQLMEKYQSTYQNSYIMPLCRIGERGLYVDAEGILYPCSWISHPFDIQASKTRDKSISWEKSLFVEYKDSFNLNNHSLETVLQNSLWKKLQCSWQDSKIAFVECEKHCHRLDSAKKIAGLHLKSFIKKEPALKTVDLYNKKLKEKIKEIKSF